MASWSLDLSKWAQERQGDLDRVVRKVGMDMLTRIVLRSPVGNPDLWKHAAPAGYVGGQFRANWQVSFGTPAGGTLSGEDKSGQETIAKGHAMLASAEAGNLIWLVNNLPYARLLEYGWSQQAPAGMVRVTVKEFQSIVDRATKQ